MKQIVETIKADFHNIDRPDKGLAEAKEQIQNMIDEKAKEGYTLMSCSPTTSPYQFWMTEDEAGYGYGYSFTSGFVLMFSKT